MREKIIENIVKASSEFGDFLQHPVVTILRWMDGATRGSMPERKLSDCKDMECELNHLHNIELRGYDEA